MSQVIVPLLIGLLLGLGVAIPIFKIIEKPCPSCNCPPAAEIKLQSPDFESLRKVKGDFVFAPEMTNVRVIFEARDSLIWKELIKCNK